MRERLTQKAKKKLEERELDLQRQLKEKQTAFGSAIGAADGDSYHDEIANLLENQLTQVRTQLSEVSQILSRADSEPLTPPRQNDRVQIGNRAKVNLQDDPEAASPMKVVVLTRGNVRALADEYSRGDQIIVSDESPLGKALLGKQRDQKVVYNSGRTAEILDIDIPDDIFS